jgi:putative oxidoreductase
VLAHRKNGFFVFKDGYEYVLLISVVALSLATTGPGRFSVDNAAGISVTGWAGGGIALGVAVAATAGMLATFYRPGPKQPADAAEATEATELAETNEAADTAEPAF